MKAIMQAWGQQAEDILALLKAVATDEGKLPLHEIHKKTLEAVAAHLLESDVDIESLSPSLDAAGDRRVGATTGLTWADRGVFKPIIAAIDGFCVAGGLEVSLQCDIRVATRKSQFGLPEPRWSILAGYGLHNLSRMVPLGEALYMQLTGRRIDSDRAYRIGLIQEVVEDRDALFKEVDRIAEEIKMCAPLAVQSIKRIVYQGRNLPVEYSMKLSGPIAQIVGGTEDAIEGPKAFSEKRKPRWKMR